MDPETTSQSEARGTAPTETETIITNMGAGLMDYIGAGKPFPVIVLGCEALATTICLCLFFLLGRNSSASVPLLAGALVLGGHVFARIRSLHEQAVLSLFAKANNFDFDPHGAVDESYGTLFRVAGFKSVADVVTGSYHGQPIRAFMLSDTIQQGRSSHTYINTIIELTLGGKMPSILLLDKRSKLGGLNLMADNSGLSLAEFFGTKNQISLEGDFNNYFTLLADASVTNEALEVFTPDVMEIVEQSDIRFTVELASDRLYIYAPGYLKNSDNLVSAFKLISKLLPKLEPLSERFAGDTSLPSAKVNQSLPDSISLVPASFNIKIVYIMLLAGGGLVLAGVIVALASH